MIAGEAVRTFLAYVNWTNNFQSSDGSRSTVHSSQLDQAHDKGLRSESSSSRVNRDLPTDSDGMYWVSALYASFPFFRGSSYGFYHYNEYM